MVRIHGCLWSLTISNEALVSFVRRLTYHAPVSGFRRESVCLPMSRGS